MESKNNRQNFIELETVKKLTNFGYWITLIPVLIFAYGNIRTDPEFVFYKAFQQFINNPTYESFDKYNIEVFNIFFLFVTPVSTWLLIGIMFILQKLTKKPPKVFLLTIFFNPLLLFLLIFNSFQPTLFMKFSGLDMHLLRYDRYFVSYYQGLIFTLIHLLGLIGFNYLSIVILSPKKYDKIYKLSRIIFACFLIASMGIHLLTLIPD